MIVADGIKGTYLEYKGKPLVRCENEIYYGDMSKKYYLFILITGYKDSAKFGVKIADKVMVQILPTQGTTPWNNKMVDSLSEAFDLGCAWLERANKE